MIQGQSNSNFLHEVAHKSIIQKFNSPYPYTVSNSTEEFNFLKSTKDVLCKLFLILQEKCIDICEIKRNSSEELNSDIAHVHSSLHKFLSQLSCLKALGEYGNNLYETYSHIIGQYYTTTFLDVLDIAIPLIANITPSNFSHKESNQAIYLTFAELKSIDIETLRDYISHASKRYLPVLENIGYYITFDKRELTQNINNKETAKTLFAHINKKLPNTSLNIDKFEYFWEQHLKKIKFDDIKDLFKEFSIGVINSRCNITHEQKASYYIDKATTNSLQEYNCTFTSEFLGTIVDLAHRDIHIMKIEILPRGLQTIMKKYSDDKVIFYDESYDSNCELEVFSPIIDYYLSVN